MKRNKIEFRNWRIELNRKNMNREFQEQNLIKQKKQQAKSKIEHLKLYSQSRKRKKSEKSLWDTTGKSIHTLWEFQREDKEKK